MEKLDGKSKDIVKDNIDKLKQLFPDVFTEDGIDFDVLKDTLGEYVDDKEERYQFAWHGKTQARRLAQTPSTGTLRPCKEESVNWDNTQNLFIEGDNLEVLKLLQKAYHKEVKMIYIDPPYNTGNDFIYKDDFRDNIKNYKKLTGQIDSEGMVVSTNSETSGRYHTDWLNMIYPRLKLARNLLKDDGVIFVSIDDNEIDNLKKISNEIFGEDNFLAVVSRVAKTTSFRGNYFAPSKDYILCIAKNISDLKPFQDEVNESQFAKIETEGQRKGEYYRDDIAFYLSTLETRPNQRYFIECPDGEKVIPPGNTFPPEKPKEGDGVWRWNLESFKEKKQFIVFKKSKQSPLLNDEGKQAGWNLYTKSYLNDKKENGNIPRDFWDGFLNRHGTSELKKLEIPYSFPKPVEMIEYLMKISNVTQNDIVLDFFAGSATTAHAVIKLNSLDKKNRKFIMIQIPEDCQDNVEASKAGFKKLTDIGKERVRRVIKKIEAEQDEKKKQGKGELFEQSETDTADLDLGFKVFKLDASNISTWDPDFDTVQQDLLSAVDNIKTDRSEADVLYEILLKYGLDLAVPIEELEIKGKKVFVVGMGALIVCLASDVTVEIVEEIAKLKDKYQPEVEMRVVFKDSSFKDDVVKTNAVQILKQHGIEDVKSI